VRLCEQKREKKKGMRRNTKASKKGESKVKGNILKRERKKEIPREYREL
jgi:hypothetical protein